MVSKAWNRDRLLNFGEAVIALVGYVGAAVALAYLVRRYG